MLDKIVNNFKDWIARCGKLKPKKMNTLEKIIASVCGTAALVLIIVSVVVSNNKLNEKKEAVYDKAAVKYDLTYDENNENISYDIEEDDEDNGIFSFKTAFYGTLKGYFSDIDGNSVGLMIITDKGDLFNSGEYEIIKETDEGIVFKYNDNIKTFAEKRNDKIYENKWSDVSSDELNIAVIKKH